MGVDFLQGITDAQIRRPHRDSLDNRIGDWYDYAQRNMWMTNDGFRDFFYYSPVGSILAQLARTEELRITTEQLAVNPKRTCSWHQDTLTGPLDLNDTIRFWIAMDDCGEGGFGVPEFLVGSHKNLSVDPDQIWVVREKDDMAQFPVGKFVV